MLCTFVLGLMSIEAGVLDGFLGGTVQSLSSPILPSADKNNVRTSNRRFNGFHLSQADKQQLNQQLDEVRKKLEKLKEKEKEKQNNKENDKNPPKFNETNNAQHESQKPHNLKPLTKSKFFKQVEPVRPENEINKEFETIYYID